MYNLEVSQPAGEVEDVSQVCFGISVAAGWFGHPQLLGDGEELQRTERKHLAGLQQLLTYSTQTDSVTLLTVQTRCVKFIFSFFSF